MTRQPNLGVRGDGWRWRWAIVAFVSLVATIVTAVRLVPALLQFAGAFFQQSLNEQSARADVVSMFLSAAGLGISLAGLVVAILQLRQGSRQDRLVSLQGGREEQALDQVRSHLGRQERLPRMGDSATQALALRVHPAIELPPTTSGAKPTDRPSQSPAAGWRRLPLRWRRRAGQRSRLDRDLPLFVDRDQGRQLRSWMKAARKTGGFLVLVGDSSVGKTRLLYESARQILPDFAVLAPDLGDGRLVNQLAAARFRLPRLLVWLDELQRFLDGPYLSPGSTPITAGTVRRLLDTPTPVVVVGTLWPQYASQLRASGPDPATGQDHPRYPRALDVLNDRRIHEVVLGTFSKVEREAAARLAASDPRLATAVADRDYNVTEVLAGARELVRRYEHATREHQAVVEAAVDARRLGIQAPLTDKLLCAAARGYLTGVYPDDRWFGPVLAELTTDRRPQDRATAPLIAVPDPDHSRVLGYTVADYLLQRLARQRRSVRVPGATWQALITDTSDPGGLARLADSAERRLLYCYAIPLYRRLADNGDQEVAKRLIELLVKQGQVDEALELLRSRADAGDTGSAGRLAGVLMENGRIDELRILADAGAPFGAWGLAELLVSQGRIEELRSRAEAGDGSAVQRLMELLVKQGRVDEAIELLRPYADGGWARTQLANLLAKQGRVEELRTRAEAGDSSAVRQLANLLTKLGRIDEAIELLRSYADTDDQWAVEQLANLLVKRGRVDESIELLRTRVDAGDSSAVRQLANLLTKLGYVDKPIELLRSRADAGDRLAAMDLAKLLAKHGRVEELHTRSVSDEWAANELGELLVKQGRIDDLRTRADAGDYWADNIGGWLPQLLAKQGNFEELRRRADDGNYFAGYWLTKLLAEQGRIEELRIEVDAGTPHAGDQLRALLNERGQIQHAEQLRRWGINPDGTIAAGEDVRPA